MKKMNYFKLIVLLSTLSCADELKIHLHENNTTYYYCAILERGLDFAILNPITSMNDFKKKKIILEKDFPKNDANYFKVVSKNKKKILYGYSMRTNKLMKKIELDENGKLKFLKEFEYDSNKTKECFWSYAVSNRRLISTKKCNDDSKTISYFQYSEEWKTYIRKNEEHRYEKDKLKSKFFYTYYYDVIKKFDENKTLISEENFVAESDLCTPFIRYPIK